MKRFWLICSFIICCAPVNAQYSIQKGSEISLGVNGFPPLGNFINLYAGVNLKYAYNFNSKIAATASAGYLYIYNNGNGWINCAPVKFGARFTYRNIFYIEPQIGGAYRSYYYYYSNDISSPDFFNTEKRSSILILNAVQIGVILTKHLDLNVRYEIIYNGNGYFDNFNGKRSVSAVSLGVACRLPFNNR